MSTLRVGRRAITRSAQGANSNVSKVCLQYVFWLVQREARNARSFNAHQSALAWVGKKAVETKSEQFQVVDIRTRLIMLKECVLLVTTGMMVIDRGDVKANTDTSYVLNTV